MMPSTRYKNQYGNAFKLIPVKPPLYPKLGIHFDNFYYYDKTLPQGCASFCRIWNFFNITTMDHWTKVPNIKTVHYLDDYIFVAPANLNAKNHLQAFRDICQSLHIPIGQSLHIPIAPDKTTSPDSTITSLGIELDTVKRVACLRERIQGTTEFLQNFLNESMIQKRRLDSLIRKLSFSTSVVPGRAFLRRLCNKASVTRVPFHFIKISRSMWSDTSIWLLFSAKLQWHIWRN